MVTHNLELLPDLVADVLVVGMHPRQRSLALVRIIDAERVTWPEAFQFEQHSEVVGPLGPVASGRRGHDPRYGPLDLSVSDDKMGRSTDHHFRQ